jgi:hypothetical protein
MGKKGNEVRVNNQWENSPHPFTGTAQAQER